MGTKVPVTLKVKGKYLSGHPSPFTEERGDLILPDLVNESLIMNDGTPP